MFVDNSSSCRQKGEIYERKNRKTFFSGWKNMTEKKRKNEEKK
jgi:hypothetical protein